MSSHQISVLFFLFGLWVKFDLTRIGEVFLQRSKSLHTLFVVTYVSDSTRLCELTKTFT